MTPEQIKALAMPELVAFYNRLTGESIKRFSTRAVGERRVLKELAARQPQLPTGTPRIVRGSSSGGKNGRPKSQYIVQLTADKAQSKPQKASDRTALIEWLRNKGSIQHNGETLAQAASIDSIEAHFGRRMRGVAQKLVEKNWLRRINLA